MFQSVVRHVGPPAPAPPPNVGPLARQSWAAVVPVRHHRASSCRRTQTKHIRLVQASRCSARTAFTERDVWSLTSLAPKVTGLPMVLYVSPKYASQGPQLKVSKSNGDRLKLGEWISLTIEENPRIIGSAGSIRVSDLMRVCDFMDLNREVLIQFWEQNEPFDVLDMLLSLQKV